MGENENIIQKDHILAIYQQAFEQHRYYITWRERLTAGFIAVTAALVIALAWLTDKGFTEYLYVVFLAGMFLSYGFYQMDMRNLSLCHVCQNVAATIEQDHWNLDFNDTTNRNLGLASVLDNSGTLLSSEDAITGKGYTEKIFNHTPVLKFTYFTMMIVCFVGLTGSIYWFNSKWVTINFKEKVISRLMDVSGAVPIVAFVLLIVVLILAFKSSDKKKKSNKNIKEFKNLGKEYRLLMRQNDLDSKKNKVTSEKRMKQIEIKVIELIKKE